MRATYSRFVTIFCGIPIGMLIAQWLIMNTAAEADLIRLGQAAVWMGVAAVVLICSEYFLKRSRD